jgi:hypothetical protein
MTVVYKHSYTICTSTVYVGYLYKKKVLSFPKQYNYICFTDIYLDSKKQATDMVRTQTLNGK